MQDTRNPSKCRPVLDEKLYMEVYQHRENLCFFGFVEFSMADSIEDMKITNDLQCGFS